LDSRPSTSDNDKLMTEAKMLQIQSKNMVIVGVHFSTTSKIWNAFLTSKVETNNQRLNKVKISNLKKLINLGVITKNEFRIGIILFLDL
jgi:autotransporter adhesin